MKPVSKVGIGLLYYNKGLQQFERALYDATEALRESGLVASCSFIVKDGAPVDFARETIVDEVMARDIDAVIWVDTDLIIPRDALVRLVSMSNAGYLIAAGLYRRAMHSEAERFILTRMDQPRWATLEELRAAAQGGVTQVAVTAGGFSIVRREVYQMVREQCGPPWYCCYDPEIGDWCFEDTYFQRRLYKLGIPVHVDPNLHAIHWSKYGPVPVTPDDPMMAEYVA